MLPAPLIRHLAAACLLTAGWMGARPAAPRPASQAEAYLPTVESIRSRGLADEGAFDILSRLLERAPRRLPGSPGYEAAVRACLEEMRGIGLRTWTEPAVVSSWIRGGPAEAVLLGAGPNDRLPLDAAALGLSAPTPVEGLEAPVYEARSFEELAGLGEKVRGAVIFFNHPMDRTRLETFSAYGEAGVYRTRGASEAARLGAAAVLVRSLTLRLDDAPHAGMVAYDPALPSIPAAAISTRSAEALSARLRSGRGGRVRLRWSAVHNPPAQASIVIGQWDGAELPREVILLAGHLDAWDLSPGAHDDGAGCAQAMEAVRILKALGLKPRRSLRIVLYPDEEYGASAGRAYAASPARTGERILAAMESDRGGFLPVGFGMGTEKSFEKLRIWEPLLRACGIHWVRPGGGGSDVGPLAERGTVTLGFIPDSQRYFDVHHSAHDVLASVHPRELELGAIVQAVMAYVLAQEGV